MKPILVSGIQPSGRMHIGNYLGALKNFVELQNSKKYRCFYFLADLHSFTSVKDPFDAKQKQREIIELTADFLAVGIDPVKSALYLQSFIPAHSELAWMFATVTPMGDLRRMTQFKQKALEQTRSALTSRIPRIINEGVLPDGVDMDPNLGLLAYPTLMAADILLYDPMFVPVGEDQVQHLELTRTVARKFNARFGQTFTEPKALLTPTARVMGLADPMKKMSKSVPESCLFLDDEPDVIKAKVMRAVTDSESVIRYDRERKPGISNLLDIMSGMTDEPVAKIERRFEGKNYGEFKREVAETLALRLADFRKKKKALLKNPKRLAMLLKSGSKKAAKVADKKMAEVKRKIGVAL